MGPLNPTAMVHNDLNLQATIWCLLCTWYLNVEEVPGRDLTQPQLPGQPQRITLCEDLSQGPQRNFLKWDDSPVRCLSTIQGHTQW